MKTHTPNIKRALALAVGVNSLAALTVWAGPPVVVVPAPAPVVVAPAPVVVVQPPAPAVTVVVAVPDTYVWDGVEFVGVVGTQYYYLGAGDLWLPFDHVREVRFHDWEQAHADWRLHVIINEKYRRDAKGHEYLRQDSRAKESAHDNHDQGHDNQGHDNQGHDKDGGHGHDHGNH
jgi:hypothetical protein